MRSLFACAALCCSFFIPFLLFASFLSSALGFCFYCDKYFAFVAAVVVTPTCPGRHRAKQTTFTHSTPVIQLLCGCSLRAASRSALGARSVPPARRRSLNFSSKVGRLRILVLFSAPLAAFGRILMPVHE